MQKNELREQGFDGDHINPKEGRITLIWLALTIILIVFAILGSFSFARVVGIDSESDLNFLQDISEDIVDFLGGGVVIIFFIVFLTLYFLLKYLLNVLFCQEKDSISLTLLKINAMPICSCREAFKVWQMLLVYFVPAFSTYFLLFFMNVFSLFSTGHFVYLITICILSFFLAFDFTLVIYILFFKIVKGTEYISIDQHIYSITLFYRKIKINN